jgi:hypothetical protein
VPRSRDPGRAHDVEPEVALFADVRLARVQADAHEQLAPVRPLVVTQRALRLDGGCHRVACPREREEERVALRVDLGAAVGAERLPHDPPVVARDAAELLVPEFLQQARRALDIGEDERDGAAG